MITGFYAGLLALMFLFLSGRVALTRGKSGVMFGDNGDPAMTRMVRTQGNFAEYVPFAVLLMALYEMQAGSLYVLHGLGVALLVGRISHALGLSREILPARGLGVLLTFVVIAVLAVSLILKGFDLMQAL